MIRVYLYDKCGTCRRAVHFLQAHNISFQAVPIRQPPPSMAELKIMLAACDGHLRRLFNTSGGDYRELKLGERLPSISSEAALSLLAGRGNLVKRPFLIGPGVALAGFNEAEWSAALLKLT